MRTFRKALITAALTLAAITAVAQNGNTTLTPYAIWCEDNTTLYFTARSETLSAGGTFTPEGSSETAAITNIWSGTGITETEGEYDIGWMEIKSNATKVVFESNFQNVKPTRTRDWFKQFINLGEIIGINYLNTEQVTDMGFMFDTCVSLETLDLSSFNTQSVQYMMFMFSGCGSLETLDLSSFNTQNVEYMNSMFLNCGSLRTLDLSNFNTQNVEYMNSMFSYCGGLKTLDLSDFNTQNVKDMAEMFNNCGNLRHIYIGQGWSVDDVEYSEEMFNECTSIEGQYGTTYDESATDNTYAHAGEGGYMRMHPTVTLYDYDTSQDNTSIISSAESDEQTRYTEIWGNNDDNIPCATFAARSNATISGRTLYKDGDWNTICLPFSLSAAKLYGAEIRELTSASVTGYNVSLTFSPVSAIEAGRPYIIRWVRDEEEEWEDEITDPVFHSVDFISSTPATISLDDGNVKFIGYYEPFVVQANDKTVYYLTAGNKLKYTGTNRTLKAFRAYFTFTATETAGTNDFTFDIDFGDGETTAIRDVTAEEAVSGRNDATWYTLDGRRLAGKPTHKGIYVSNGKKTVIR